MRVTAVHRFPNGTTEDTTQQTTFEYDANSVAPGFSQIVSGRLAVSKSFAATVTGGVSVTSTFYEMYSYDSAGRVLKKRLRIVNPQLGTVDKDIEYNFTNAKLNTVKYPDVNVPFTYYYDNMLRPNRMTGKDPNDFQSGTNVVDYVNSVNYNVASRMTSMWAINIGTSTYTYNERFELTRQQTGSLADIQYEYSATADNGQILSRTNNIAAEKVAYQYDSLKRLISASATNTSNNSTNWASTYGHDGWGNLLAKTPTAGSAPILSVTVNGLTNRISSGGYSYDNNGNMTSSGTFDVDNRLTTASGESYGYLTNNQRVYKRDASGNEWIYFHDASGKRIMTFQMQNSGGVLVVAGGSKNVYFAGQAVILNDQVVVTDRLSSVVSRAGTLVDFFPYGEEKSVTSNPAEKFGTYLRDATGLDYANQRYFASTSGRFLTSDPYQASGGPGDPDSSNRYAYVQGDPVNWRDPKGLERCTWDGAKNTLHCEFDKDILGSERRATEQDIPDDIFFVSASARRDFAESLRQSVMEGLMDDCSALAAFAGGVQSAAASTNKADYLTVIESFKVLVSSNDMGGNFKRINDSFRIIPTSSPDQTVQFQTPGRSSGYQTAYRDNSRPEADQGHHFAAFFMLGGLNSFLPDFVGKQVSAMVDDPNNNPGDYSLGVAAFNLGKQYSVNRGQMNLYGEINKLCVRD